MNENRSFYIASARDTIKKVEDESMGVRNGIAEFHSKLGEVRSQVMDIASGISKVEYMHQMKSFSPKIEKTSTISKRKKQLCQNTLQLLLQDKTAQRSKPNEPLMYDSWFCDYL